MCDTETKRERDGERRSACMSASVCVYTLTPDYVV